MATLPLRWMVSLLLAAWALMVAAAEEEEYDLKKIPLRTHSLQSVSLSAPQSGLAHTSLIAIPSHSPTLTMTCNRDGSILAAQLSFEPTNTSASLRNSRHSQAGSSVAYRSRLRTGRSRSSLRSLEPVTCLAMAWQCGLRRVAQRWDPCLV